MNRLFRLLQLAVGTADLSDGMFRVLIPILGLAIDRSTLAITLVSLSVRLPGLIVAVPTGHLLDRTRREPLFSMGSSVIRMACTAGLCAMMAADLQSIPALCALSFVAIAASNVNDLAVQSSLSGYVTKEQLPAANSWIYSAQTLLVQMVGPGAIGVLLGRASSAAALGIIAVFFALSAAVFVSLLVAVPRTESDRKPAGRPGFLYGFRYLAAHPALLGLALLAALNNLCYAMIFTFLPAWVITPGPIGASPGAYGWVVAAMAVGSLTGGYLGSRLRDVLTDARVTRWSFTVIAIGFAAVLPARLPLLVVGLAVYGFAIMIWNVRIVSFRQAAIPQGEFGRVNAAFRWFSMGAPAVGALSAGALSPLIGMRGVFVTSVAMLAVAAVVTFARPITLDLEPAPVAQTTR
ncbi:MFS transporter [Kitasatospora sp. NPDC058162]|uniref:MFS transporter n=1 Tax=Kitasatospora sp. NPDC058162 TaxID=3346362 RepID=UPI0036D8E309